MELKPNVKWMPPFVNSDGDFDNGILRMNMDMVFHPFVRWYETVV
jgi:hypothetical protein